MLWAMGLGNRWDPRRVCNRSVHGSLARVHVAEGRVEVGALAGGMAVVGVGALVLGVVVLCACDGWVGRAVMVEVEGAVVELLRGVLLLLVAVMTRTKLLCLDVCPLLGLALLAVQS